MNDLDAALRATYQARSRTPEPPDLLDEVLAMPDLDIPQQRRWLPQPTGRFQSMFSATKFVVAGAIVALFGGFLFMAQPFGPQGASVPGAATDVDAAAPVEFTATIKYGESAGAEENLFPVIATDPRFEGTLSWTATRERYPGADIEVEAVSVRVENDDGSWEQPGWLQLANLPDEPESSEPESSGSDSDAVTYVGQGGYEGLFIVAEETFHVMTLEAELHGYIFEGEPPFIE